MRDTVLDRLYDAFIETNSAVAGGAPALRMRLTGGVTGALTVTSTSSSALAVGANGATNPVLQVDASTASVATGWKMTGAAAGGGADLSVISSGAAEAGTINAKSTSAITIGSVSTGGLNVGTANTDADLTVTLGAGGGAQTANRGVSINLKVPSNGVTGTQAGAAFIDFTRNATLVWEVGIDNGTGGAKSAKDDFGFYSAQTTAAYVVAIAKHGGIIIAQKASSDGAAALSVTPGAHINVTAENIVEKFVHGTVTITGAFATNRFMHIAQPTINAASSLTITTAITQDITGAPTVTNSAVITNSYALRVASSGPTLASATGVTYAPIFVPAHTLTLTGTTQMTTAPSVSGLSLGIITVTDASAVTVNSAATLYIAGAPLAAGSVTLTTPYALWVDAGASQFDGAVTLASTLTMTTATSQIIPGATNLSLRNNANSADNLLITDAGAATIRAGLTVTAGGATITAGNVAISAGTLAVTSAATAGGVVTLTLTPGSHTAVVAESITADLGAPTITITGAFATQRFYRIGQPTISAASSLTVTTASTINIAGAPTIASSAVITDTAALRIGLGTTTTIANAAASVYAGLRMAATTVALSTTTQMTGAIGVASINVGIVTVNQTGGAVTLDNGASLYIAGALTAGASVTITNNYALWVDAGSSRLDGSIVLNDKITTYNAVATVAWGVPAIYGSGRSTAQTAAVASVATYTVGAADGSFIVSANVLVTTSTTHNFTVTVAYTDEGNTARTLTLNFSSLGGTLATTIVNTGGAVPYEGVPMHIRCKAATAITVATTGTFTSIVYNVEGIIAQVA